MEPVVEDFNSIIVSAAPDDLDLLLMPQAELVRLGLRSYIFWEKDVHQFFRRLHALHALQEQMLISLMEKWRLVARQGEPDPAAWKALLEREYDLLLPERTTRSLLNPYRVSLLLACVKTFQERCKEELLKVIALMRPAWIYGPGTLLQTFLTNESLLAEFILMLEELYTIRIADNHLLYTDSVALVAKKVTRLVFAQSPELQGSC